MSTPAHITKRPIVRPEYAVADTFEAWMQVNVQRVADYWSELEGDSTSVSEFMDFARAQYDSSNSADCDVCQYRPGTHMVIAAGIETWSCDKCSDISSYMRPHHANAWQNRDADDAGQPMYGEL